MTLFVLGNSAVDILYDVPHLPRPGETLLAAGETRDFGGKGFNQAIMAKRAGAKVSFWSAVGDDTAGGRLTSLLLGEGIDASDVRAVPGNTDRSIIFVAPSGENTIVSTAAMARGVDDVYVQHMRSKMRANDLLLMQGNLTRDVTRLALNGARTAGVRTIINPAPIDFDYDDILPEAEIVIVNEIESLTLSSCSDVDDAAVALINRGVSAVVTTCGAAGAVLHTKEMTDEFPAPNVDAIDTTGAGDVFCGVLVGGLAQNMTLDEACGWAVRAAATAVTRRGTMAAFPDAAAVAAQRR